MKVKLSSFSDKAARGDCVLYVDKGTFYCQTPDVGRFITQPQGSPNDHSPPL